MLNLILDESFYSSLFLFVPLLFLCPGENDRIEGDGHGNLITGIKVSKDSLYTCGIDDSLRKIDVSEGRYVSIVSKLTSQPLGMDVYEDIVVVATVKEVCLTRGPSIL